MVGFYNYTVWLTYLSLISGTTGITLCFMMPDKPLFAILCLLFSGLCDTFDGKVARTKKDRTSSEKSFGIQIDSLVDLVCFGVLPACILITLALNTFEKNIAYCFIPLAVMFVLFGMIRLAYFNVLELERQAVETSPTNKYFLGVPITMSSIIMPLAFVAGNVFRDHKYVPFIIYASFLLILGLAFVIKVKIPKFRKKGIIVLVAIGIVALVGLILLEIL